MMAKRSAIWIGVFVLAGAALVVSSSRLGAAERSLSEAMALLEETSSQAREVERLRSATTAGSGGRSASAEGIDEALRRSGISPDRIAVFRTGQPTRPATPRGQSNGAAHAGLTAVLELEGIPLAHFGEFLAMLDAPGPRWRASRIDLDLSPGGSRCNVMIHLETP